MELEESLLRLRESLGKWSLKVRISPLKAAEYRKSAGKGKIEYELKLPSSKCLLSLTQYGLAVDKKSTAP